LEANAVKKKRGRAKKSTLQNTTSVGTDSVKKTRRRPKKSTPSDPTVLEIHIVKKTRGRPKKSVPLDPIGLETCQPKCTQKKTTQTDLAYNDLGALPVEGDLL